MTVATVPDEEFIALWRHHGSAAKLARVLDIAVRNVAARRARLERKHNIQLETIDTRAPRRPPVRAEHPGALKLSVTDGYVVIFSDAHFWPGIRTTAFKGLLHIIKRLRPAAVICNGDAFDGASISRYPRIGWDKVPTLLKELEACKDALGEVEEAAGRSELFWPMGNHDSRFETRLAAQAGEFEGVQGFHLKDHFPAWAPCWRVDVNADVIVKHRDRGGVHATRNNTVNSGRSMFTGHLHSLKVAPFTDFNGTRYGVDTGHIAEPSGPQFVNYLEAKVPDWRSGFAVAAFKGGRMLIPQLAQRWDDDRIEFCGHVIDVRKE